MFSLLDIAGHLSNTTPLVVITEICRSAEVVYSPAHLNDASYRKTLITRLKELQDLSNLSVPLKVNEEYREKQTVFLNPDVEWHSTRSMNKALGHLFKFTSPARYRTVSSMFTIGLPIPSDTQRYNACILYRYCYEWNIGVTLGDNLETLSEKVRVLAYTEPELKQSILSYLSGCQNTQTLLRICLSILPDQSEMKLDFASYRNIISFYNNSGVDINSIRPLTSVQAVVLGALQYNLDLSYFDDPLKVYMSILHKTPCKEYIALMNSPIPEIKSCSLEYHFNPTFPPEMYQEGVLQLLAENEGFTEEEIEQEGPYFLLQLTTTISTFYHGLPETSELINRETYIDYQELSELQPYEVLCYGPRLDSKHIITYEELLSSFRYHKEFKIPQAMGSTYLDTLTVRKLKKLADKPKRADNFETPEHINIRYELSSVIEDIGSRQTNDIDKWGRWLSSRFSNVGQQSMVIRALRAIHRAAMFMRGWGWFRALASERSDNY
jgi:hypothetical protein